MAQVKLVSECFIKPNLEAVSEASKKPYNLSPMDIDTLCANYMQKGLMYTKSYDAGFQTEVFLLKLKHSFSLSLVHFYPLAGRFATQTFPDEHACCIFLDCVNSPGARFIHASLDSTVSDVLSGTDVHPAFRSFYDLGERAINYDGHTNALLSLQVTELVDGIFIGFSFSHSIGDGTSLEHFITTLSEIFNSVGNSLQNWEKLTYVPISREPIFEPFFPDGYGPVLKLPYVEPSEFLSRENPASIREKIFQFSRVSMSRLKAMANNGVPNDGNRNNEISSFQALSGLIWRAITRARKLEPEMETNCSLTMNLRPRLIPPLSQEYFGNYFSRIRASCKVGELLNTGLGWGSLLLHASLKNVDDKAIIESFRKYCEAPIIGQLANDSAFFGVNFVKIVGSHRSNLFGTEFGMGRPVAIRTGNVNEVEGRVSVSQGSEGAGSVDLEVSLAPSTMTALEMDEEFMSFVTLG
ncbi:uncharacterized acetyltransferase At3g50280-like [Chenopodium quinoa]|uniref:BAHD acyltransferase n=1 Tax=Chenopodium quinoa TaxID=63459 RepID=A0A803LGY2_CHEQI|nr:uncharacterized acetyltransferase At3g50280-like [Chenopodium quinoa]